MEYREEPCRSALNRVKGMPFEWSLNPYTGCAHRCTFCYVRAFEARAERLALNDLARVRLRLSAPLLVDPYDVNRPTGAFILVDEATNETVGAGMVSSAAA